MAPFQIPPSPHLPPICRPQVIQGLVARSGVTADDAAELHKALYRQKLNQVRDLAAIWP